jgi:hypothetical protein
MNQRRTNRLSCVAAALALLGVVQYVALVPWHAGTSLASRAHLSQLDADLAVICRGGRGGDASSPVPGAPLDRSKDCLICAGMAAVDLALAAPPAEIARPAGFDGTRLAAGDDYHSDTIRVRARSRGPPA